MLKYHRKTTFFEKNVAHKFGFVYVLTSSDTFSCFGGSEVTLPTEVRDVTGSFTGSGKEFYV